MTGRDSRPCQRFTTPASLRSLTGLVHDLWFDLDTVALDAGRAAVDFELVTGRRRFGLTGSGGPRWGRFTVERACALEIRDDARVGYYDVGEVTGGDSLVVVRCNAPCEVRIRVLNLAVSVTGGDPVR